MSERGEDFDRLYDPDAPAQRSEEQKALDKAKEERRLLLIGLLGDENIRQWLWEIIDQGHAFEVRIASTGYSPDPIGTWLMAGEQRLAWWIWEQLDEASPELAGLMRREHK